MRHIRTRQLIYGELPSLVLLQLLLMISKRITKGLLYSKNSTCIVYVHFVQEEGKQGTVSVMYIRLRSSKNGISQPLRDTSPGRRTWGALRVRHSCFGMHVAISRGKGGG